MPKQRRHAIKQCIEVAEANIRKGQEQLVSIAQPYETVHPEIFEGFVQIVQAIEVILETTQKLSDSI